MLLRVVQLWLTERELVLLLWSPILYYFMEEAWTKVKQDDRESSAQYPNPVTGHPLRSNNQYDDT
jgi:hypothetical protein